MANNGPTVTVYESSARTATPTPIDRTNTTARGVHIIIDVTATADTPSVTFAIQGKDSISGKYYAILTSAAITSTGTTVLKIVPGITDSANAAVSDQLPHTWRVVPTHGDADSITYSVAANLVI